MGDLNAEQKDLELLRLREEVARQKAETERLRVEVERLKKPAPLWFPVGGW